MYVIYISLYLHIQNLWFLDFDEPNEDEDDSTEELFNRGPSTSGHKKTVSQESKTPDDFEKVYTTITMTDTV